MYTQVAIHGFTIGLLAASQFSSTPPTECSLLDSLSLSLFLWTGFSFFESLDGVCRSQLTLLESEYCPTSFPTVHPKVLYK